MLDGRSEECTGEGERSRGQGIEWLAGQPPTVARWFEVNRYSPRRPFAESPHRTVESRQESAQQLSTLLMGQRGQQLSGLVPEELAGGSSHQFGQESGSQSVGLSGREHGEYPAHELSGELRRQQGR